MTIAYLRKEYTLQGLNEADAHTNPFVQFRRWFDEAVKAELYEPNAMTLATVTADGKPSARVVLLKEVDDLGFVFYTSYASRKGTELAHNPWAALVFWWGELERQVRIEGSVAKVAAHESDSYFHSRPHGSRLGAWASQQSQVIDNRTILEQRMQELVAEYTDREVPRPPSWGGYRLTPTVIEFWKGRQNRLHDRLRYCLQEDGNWHIERLSP